LSVGGVDIGSDQIVKFDSVKTNIGGGYDPFTGVFIAPNPGTFQFVSVIYSNGNDDVEAQMNKNNELNPTKNVLPKCKQFFSTSVTIVLPLLKIRL
jgi:hypothetical protein